MLTTPQVQAWCLRLRFSRQAYEVILVFVPSFPHDALGHLHTTSVVPGCYHPHRRGCFIGATHVVAPVVATDPDVAEAVVQTAEQEKVDFIAMATHGRGGVQHWALGSITERVLHAAKSPLFIIRPQSVSIKPESKAGEGEKAGE